MPVTSDDVKLMAKQQLAWLDRNLTFRKALGAIPSIATAPTEQLVFLLIGTVAGRLSLIVLTTDRIYALGPFSAIAPVGAWNGTDLLLLTVHENALIRVNFIRDDTRPERPGYFDITGASPQLANSFLAFSNVLCTQRLWGDPAGFAEFIMHVATRSEAQS